MEGGKRARLTDGCASGRFFMSIGSAIRTEAPSTSMQAWASARAAPILMAAAAAEKRERN